MITFLGGVDSVASVATVAPSSVAVCDAKV
jgi:hypothetical protein